MANPILQMLNVNRQNRQSDMAERLKAIKQFLSGKNSTIIYEQLMKSNPQFRSFIQNAEGKTVEDLAMEYDIDLSLLKQFM